MTAEAKPSKRRKQESPPSKEQEIPQDALLTRGFVQRLPSYIKGQRIEYGKFSGKPNWSGETEHEGKPVKIEVRENSDNALDIVVQTPERKDKYRSEIKHQYPTGLSYMLYELVASEIPIFPLVSEEDLWKPEWFNRERINFYREERLYFIDKENHSGSVSNERIIREGELEQHRTKNSLVFKSFEMLKALMLQATPTTPPKRDW